MSSNAVYNIRTGGENNPSLHSPHRANDTLVSPHYTQAILDQENDTQNDDVVSLRINDSLPSDNNQNSPDNEEHNIANEVGRRESTLLSIIRNYNSDRRRELLQRNILSICCCFTVGLMIALLQILLLVSFITINRKQSDTGDDTGGGSDDGTKDEHKPVTTIPLWTTTNIMLLFIVTICLIVSCCRGLYLRCRRSLEQIIPHSGTQTDGESQRRIRRNDNILRELVQAGFISPTMHSNFYRRLQLAMTERDFNAEDYENLLELDADAVSRGLSEADIRRLPVVRIPVASSSEKSITKTDGNTIETENSETLPPSPHLMNQDQISRPSDNIRESSEELTLKLLNENCAVCLEQYKPCDVVMMLPCLHRFHHQCASHWLKTRATCPICLNIIRN